jgi:hypothetical protein
MLEAPNPGQLTEQLAEIAQAFAEIGLRVSASNAHVFQAIVDVTVERVPAADAASITQLSNDRFVTVASTSAVAVSADKIQYTLGSGPCVDAILEQTIYRPRDLRTDRRWPEFGRQAAELGVRSMLSYRMNADHGSIGGLNVYAGRVDAFDDTAAAIGLLLATHGAVAASAAANRSRAEHLEVALATNRQIGQAMGVLMAMHNVSEGQAFDLLRIASQNTNRKLRDVAADVIHTRTLDVVSPPRDGQQAAAADAAARPPTV